jgi:hypothetical protein
MGINKNIVELEILVKEVRQAFENYDRDKDLSFLRYALDCVNQIEQSVISNDEEMKLVFEIAPEPFIQLYTEEYKQLILEEDKEAVFSLDFIFRFSILNLKDWLGLELFKTFFSYLYNNLKKHELQRTTQLYLKVVYEDLFDNRENINAYLLELIETKDSWLAYNMLADVYYDDGNYENALKGYKKGNSIISPTIAFLNEEGNKEALLEGYLENLESEIDLNNLQIFKCHYMLIDPKRCLKACDEQLNKTGSSFFMAYGFDAHFYKAYSQLDLKKNKEALLEINKALAIDNTDERAIKFKLYLLEKLKLYKDKIDYINELQTINMNLFITYSLQLERLRKKEQGKPVKDELIEQEIERNVDVKLSKRLLGGISHSGNEFTSEKLMEAFIVSYIDKGSQVFGRKLKIYEDDIRFGRQFRVKNGFIDLLLIDESNNDLYIVELKKDKGYNNPTEQVLEYLSYIRAKVAKKDQKVYGILCLSESDENLKESIKAIHGLELYTYDLTFHKII